MSFKKFLSFALALALMITFLPEAVVSAAAAEPPAGNDVIYDVEDWHWEPAAAFARTRLMSRSSGGSSNSVTVTVKAIDKATKKAVPVEGAIVTLYIGAEAYRTSAGTDAEGTTTLSLQGLTEEQLASATISAYKVVAQTDGLDDTTRNPLFDHLPDNEEGENIRLEYQLHSETIDSAGNWIGEPLPLSYKPSNKADICFVIDGTGSMSSAINSVKTNLASFAEALVNQGLDIRFSIVEYRDITDGEPTQLHVLDGKRWHTDLASVTSILSGIRATGGGDTPETAVDALGLVAQDSMYWRSDARKYAFLLTDAGYKNQNNYGYASMNQLIDDLAAKQIVTSVITRKSEKATYSKLIETTGGIFADVFSGDFRTEMLELARNIVDLTIADMELTLTEPRFLFNLTACYLANDKTSQSASYQNSIKTMLKAYSRHIAQATDGHVLINQILLTTLDDRLDFYTDTQNGASPLPGSMADIRIESREDDDGTWWNNVIVWENAHIDGFSYAAYVPSEHSLDWFIHLKGSDNYKNRQQFARIQMGGVTINGYSVIDDASEHAKSLTHESGHYLFGFYDEYKDNNGTPWDDSSYSKPTALYGLMDNQHSSVELSTKAIEYSYFGDSISINASNTRHTQHSARYFKSTEDSLAAMMSTGLSNDFNVFLFNSPYEASYSKVEMEHRTAGYSYAELSDDDIIVIPESSLSTPAARTLARGAGNAVSAAILAGSLTNTQNSLAAADFLSNDDAVTLTLSHGTDDLQVYVKLHGQAEYSEVPLAKHGEDYKALLPIGANTLAEVLVSNGTAYNRYYIDRYAEAKTGALYTSADNAVKAYTNSKGTTSFTFVADNTGYKNGEFSSVNQATHIAADQKKAFNGGEIYSVASHAGNIDYSSISWFRFADGVWKKLPTDCTVDEAFNIGARADLDGDGLYVLMAKAANPAAAKAVNHLAYTRSRTQDGVVTLNFEDPNAKTRYYHVYYSNESFASADAPNLVKRTYTAGTTSLILDLLERDRTVYLAVEAVQDDGSRSPLSSMIVITGAADSDGDGIPDWYCNKHLLWPKNGEEKNIANSDDDGDFLSNLEEYKRGSDPRNPNDPYRTTAVPVTGVSVNPSELKLACGQSANLLAIITPENATNKTVIWTAEYEGIVSLYSSSGYCQVTGLSVGTTTLFATTQDGGYAAKCVVTVSPADDTVVPPVDAPVDPEQPDDDIIVVPPTGDSFQLELLICLLLTSAIFMALLDQKRRQHT